VSRAARATTTINGQAHVKKMDTQARQRRKWTSGACVKWMDGGTCNANFLIVVELIEILSRHDVVTVGRCCEKT